MRSTEKEGEPIKNFVYETFVLCLKEKRNS